MNLFGALVFGLLAFAVVGDFLGDGASAKADTNCDSRCDSKIDLGTTMFLLIIPIGIGVTAGIIPHPRTWISG
jgi:hypothetical protein